MLVIREPQMAALEHDLFVRFEDRALAHVREFFGAQCEAIGPTATLYYVRYGLDRARRYGFESEYDMLRFLNLMFSFGCDFDIKAEYAWTRHWLDDRETPSTVRMDALMEQFQALLACADAPEAAVDKAPEEPEEFDGIVWEEDSGPVYIPISIVPEIEPWERGPAPGTVPMEPWEDEDDWQPDWVEEEESGG